MNLRTRALLLLGLLVFGWVLNGAAAPEDERRRQLEVAELLGRMRLLELLAERSSLEPDETRVLETLRPFLAAECPGYFRAHIEPYLNHSLRSLISDPARTLELVRVRNEIRNTRLPAPADWRQPAGARPEPTPLRRPPPSSGLWLMVCWGAWSQSGLGRAWELANPGILEAERERRFALADSFDPAALNPAQVADLALASRCEGVVIVTQHLDGVPLFGDSSARDSLGRLVGALRERGLDVGLYYCLQSFRHADSVWSPYHPRYTPAFSEAFPERWARFERDALSDLSLLVERYRPDVLWLDERWRLRDSDGLWERLANLKRRHVGLQVNDRGTGALADFSTYEDVVPKEPMAGAWEAVIAISNGPGFWHRTRPNAGFKSGLECVELLRRARGHSARLLLSAAPDGNGRFEPAEVEALSVVGAWIGAQAQETQLAK